MHSYKQRTVYAGEKVLISLAMLLTGVAVTSVASADRSRVYHKALECRYINYHSGQAVTATRGVITDGGSFFNDDVDSLEVVCPLDNSWLYNPLDQVGEVGVWGWLENEDRDILCRVQGYDPSTNTFYLSGSNGIGTPAATPQFFSWNYATLLASGLNFEYMNLTCEIPGISRETERWSGLLAYHYDETDK